MFAWKDVQKRFESVESALERVDNSKQFRLMAIDGKLRTPMYFSVPIN